MDNIIPGYGAVLGFEPTRCTDTVNFSPFRNTSSTSFWPLAERRGGRLACAMQHCHLWARRAPLNCLSSITLALVCVRERRSRSGRARRACHLEETPPRRPTARPVASPAQWSPGSSQGSWCKSCIYSFLGGLLSFRTFVCVELGDLG